MNTLLIKFIAGRQWFICSVCRFDSNEKFDKECPCCGARFRRVKMITITGEVFEEGSTDPSFILEFC